MRTTWRIIFWGIQVNLAAWLVVAGETRCQVVSALVGLGIAAVLEHVGVRHLCPGIQRLRPGRPDQLLWRLVRVKDYCWDLFSPGTVAALVVIVKIGGDQWLVAVSTTFLASLKTPQSKL
jgi:hypothetical protein